MKRMKGSMDLERWAPGLFVFIGIAMLVVAALDYLSSGVSGTFVVLGTALIIFGGLLRSIEGAFKVGPHGIEATIKARAEIAATVIEEKDPDDAKTVRTAIDWATQRQPLERHLLPKWMEQLGPDRGRDMIEADPITWVFKRRFMISDEDIAELRERLEAEHDDDDPPADAPVPSR